MHLDPSRQMEGGESPNDARGTAGMFRELRVQCVVLLVCWVITLWFHWGNDGIWFQGDSPRHALNAVFFLDVAKEGLADPIEYARHYYTRYPAITPQSYPPLFYLMLGSGFAVFGVSGLIGKLLVQGFALLLGAYTLVGFRRWISLDAGFVAGLVLLMPGIMQWSGAVMLNVPAMALGVASLFHLRCVLDQPDNGRDYKHFCAALVFAALSIATHPTVGVVIPIAASWLVLDRRWRCFLNFRVLAVVVSCILLCGTLYWLLFRMSPSQFSQSGVSMTRAASVVWPDFYFRAVPSLIGWWSLPGVLAGLVWTLMIPQFRKDTIRLVVAAGITFTLLQSIWARDERYLLWACPAAAWFIAHAFIATTRIKAFARYKRVAWGIPVFGLLAYSIYFVSITKDKLSKSVNGFAKVAENIIRIAPGEPVLYHGTYDGTLVFYLRSFDENFQQQVVLVRKLNLRPEESEEENQMQWLADEARRWKNKTAINEKWLSEELDRTQCRWLLVEEPNGDQKDSLTQALLKVVESEAYELAKVFKVDMKTQTRKIRLYRKRLPEGAVSGPASFVPMEFEGRIYPPVDAR